MIGSETYNALCKDGMELLWKDAKDQYRIYLAQTDGITCWHKVYCLNLESHTYCKSPWEDNSTTLSKIFEADVVDFDGVRHLEFNRNGIDTDGYLYYPDMNVIIEALSFIRDYANLKLKEWEEICKG